MQSLITDNVSEILVKIIEFTNMRQKIITENINKMHEQDYMPKDLAVSEFAELMNEAIEEHIENKRIILRDTKNFNFGLNGSFGVSTCVDENAAKLIKNNKNLYLELQINKLLENALNQKIAAELLKEKHGMISMFE